VRKDAISYKITGTKKVKIIGLIPTKVSYAAGINAENGEIISVDKPWWNFLAR